MIDWLTFRLRALLQRHAVDAEFDDELRDHIERETQANIARGLRPDDARRTAMAAFGGVERFKEELRDERSVRWLHDIAADVKHGTRLIRKNPLFSGAVIATLALGIGATSTIFTIVNGVLLQTPSYPEPDRVVSISQMKNGSDLRVVGSSTYFAWIESQRTFSSMAMLATAPFILTGAGEARTLHGLQVTSSFFTVLGTHPALGRVFDDRDASASAERSVILSYSLWANTFGSDTNLIGRAIVLGNIPRRVIGVMPFGFDSQRHAEFWSPLNEAVTSKVEFFHTTIGRLRDRVSVETAQADLSAVMARRSHLEAQPTVEDRAVIMSIFDRKFGAVSVRLSFLFGAVIVLLLAACVNVANLTLARSALRRREFAVRRALGASRARLSRQLLVENGLLALIGGSIGAFIPFLLVHAFVKLAGDTLAGVTDIRVNLRVLLFALACTIASVMLFGLVPALTGARVAPSSVLASWSPRSSSQKSQGFVRSSLVVIQIALALVLFTGAGLLTKSFVRALAINPGFDATHVFAARVQLTSGKYPAADSKRAFFAQFEEGVRAIPGVTSVAQSEELPFGATGYSVEMKRHPDDVEKVMIWVSTISVDYPKTVGLRLLHGRLINADDRRGTQPVALLTEALANRMFGHGNAVGSTLPAAIIAGGKSPLLVVGVVQDVQQLEIGASPFAQAFLAAEQQGNPDTYVVVRTELDAPVLRDAMKRVLGNLDPNQPLTEFVSLRDEVDKAYAPRRLNALLINVFAGLALLLAVIGLYGLMANAVVARTREVGIRIALGARGSSVLRLVLGHGVLLTAIGIIAGMALSYTFARTLSGLLFDVQLHDLYVFSAAPVTLAIVALVACYVPARHATRVNPMVALRQE